MSVLLRSSCQGFSNSNVHQHHLEILLNIESAYTEPEQGLGFCISTKLHGMLRTQGSADSAANDNALETGF